MGLLKSSVLVFGIQLLQLAASLAILIAISRTLGPEGQGAYALLLATIGLAVVIADIGGNNAATYVMAKGDFSSRSVVATLVTVSLALGALAAALTGAIYLRLQDSYFREIAAPEMFLALAAIPLSHLQSLCGGLILGLNRPVLHGWIGLIQLVVALGTVLVAQGLGGALTVFVAMTGWLLGIVAALALSIGLLRRSAGFTLGAQLPVARSFFAYGVQLYPGALLGFLHHRLDSMIVNGLLGVSGLGFYSAALAVSGALSYFANAVANTLFPYITAASPVEAGRVAAVAARNTVFIAVCGMVGLILVAPWLLPTAFGGAMIPAVLPLWLMAPGVPALVLIRVLFVYFTGTGKPGYNSFGMGASVLLGALLNLTLIPLYGVPGAAMAHSAATVATAAGLVVAFLIHARASLWDTLLLQPEDIRRYIRVVGAVRLKTVGR